MERPDTFKEVDAVSGEIEIPRLCVSDALRGMKQEVRLFTPALLVTHGRFDRDPVQEFDVRFPAERPDERPFVIDLTKDNERFFTGLGIRRISGHRRLVNWDKRLYAIVESRAEDCFNFLGGIAFSLPSENYYASVLSYDLQIKDPTAKVPTALTVKIFGVFANTFVAYVADTFVAPQVVTNSGATGYNISSFLPNNNLLFMPFDDDPMKMRDQ